MPGGGTRTFLEPDHYEASLRQAQLERYGRSLSGRPFSSPPEGRTLQLPTRLATRLPRLHAQICRLAQTKSKMLSHSEVARAIEQGLIQALITCLTTARARTAGYAKRHHARIMVRFEEVLAEHLSWPLQMPELCELIVVSDRTLRSCCAEFLGMTPTQYLLLRRLEEVRRALRDADPDIVNVAEVAHRFGFTELGRFAGRYRATFGETPSTTLQRVPKARLAAL
jgi:AraC-like DNA-binding protein